MLEAPRMEKVQPSVSTFKTPDELSKASHEFHLAWNRQTFADSYELQWATDSTFSKSKKFRVREAQRNLKVTKAQGYAARVRSLSATGEPISPFSEVEVTSFNKELFVPAPVVAKALLPKVDASRDPASNMLGGLVSTIPMPQLKEPAQETALISLEDAPTFVTFRWKSFKGAAYYTIQISEDADFTKVVTESRSDRNTYVFQKALPEGKVFWRVRAHIKKGYSVWSDPYDINVIYQ